MPCRPCKDDKTILREWALAPPARARFPVRRFRSAGGASPSPTGTISDEAEHHGGGDGQQIQRLREGLHGIGGGAAVFVFVHVQFPLFFGISLSVDIMILFSLSEKPPRKMFSSRKKSVLLDSDLCYNDYMLAVD